MDTKETAMSTLSEGLSTFFADYDARRVVKTKLSDWLPDFFADYDECRYRKPTLVATRPPIDVTGLTALIDELAQTIEASRRGSFGFDPWLVAGLRRDEVRNSSVLAWMLDPKGSHGQGSYPMLALLNAVSIHFDGGFPSHPGRYCRVRTEINPNGETADRVDIEVDAESCYMIIEVKIDAPEQAGQIERYCRQAANRPGNRPWAVIFLTPRGVAPSSAGAYDKSGRIISLSWRKLAQIIERGVTELRQDSNQAISISRGAAEYAVSRFTKMMQHF